MAYFLMDRPVTRLYPAVKLRVEDHPTKNVKIKIIFTSSYFH